MSTFSCQWFYLASRNQVGGEYIAEMEAAVNKLFAILPATSAADRSGVESLRLAPARRPATIIGHSFRKGARRAELA